MSNWVVDKTNEVIRREISEQALIYRDLLDLDELEKAESVCLVLKDNIRLKVPVKDIVEVNGVCVKFQRVQKEYVETKGKKIVTTVPFDKILYVSITYSIE